MNNLFESARATEVNDRIGKLSSNSKRLWGKMTAAQMLAHCSAALEVAVGDSRPDRIFIGRVIGGLIKPQVLKNDEPLKRNSPTAKGLIVKDDRDLRVEQVRLEGLVNRFVSAGPQGCTSHPHSFFGKMTPDEWSILMYKHLDHHLRQFGV